MILIKKIDIINFFISLTYLSVFGALMIPYNFPLFPILIFINLLLLFTNWSYIKFTFFKSNLLILYVLYVIAYFISITFFSFELFEYFVPDLRNAITSSLLLFLSIVLIRDFYQLKSVFNILYKQLFITSLVASIIGLTKFYLSLNGVFIEFFRTSEGLYPLGTSLLNDYNIFSFGLFFGLIIGILYLRTDLGKLSRIFLWISIGTIILAITLSGSRRSLIILLFLFLWFLLIEFRSYFKLFCEVFKNQVLNLKLLRPFFFLLFCLLIYFIFLRGNYFEFSDLNQFEKILVRVESLNETEGSFNQRTIRWDLSKRLIKSMEFNELLFGNGYQYLQEFVVNNANKLGTDYPHNLFFSTFFSNGIIGFLLISLLLIQSFVIYIKNLSIVSPFFIGYLISFIYLFISGDQFFSNKAIVLLIYFPIIIETKFNERK